MLCALSALPVSYLIFAFSNDSGHALFGTMAVGGAALITSPAIWYLAFPDTHVSPRRGIWIGPLMVFAAMWGMFMAISLNISAAYLDSGGMPAILFKAVFMSLLFTLFGSLYTGLLLFPLSALIAVYLRKWQSGR